MVAKKHTIRSVGKSFILVSTALLLALSALLALTPIAKATVGDASWQQVPSSNFPSNIFNWTSVASNADGTKFAAVSSDSSTVYIKNGSGAWAGYNTGGSAVSPTTLVMSADGSHLAIADSNNCSSNSGYIYTSSDGGVSWSQSPGSGHACWRSIVISADGTKLAGITHDGNFYISTDFGASWSSPVMVAAGADDIASDTTLTKFAIAAYSSGSPTYGVFISMDSGSNWTNYMPGSAGAGMVLAASADMTKLAVTGPYIWIFTSDDSGVGWTMQTNLENIRAWNDISSSADGTQLLAVASYGYASTGYVYSSTDSGVTWNQQDSLGAGSWRASAMSSDGKSQIVAKTGGSVYLSTDFGASWQEQNITGGHQPYMSFVFTSDNGQYIAINGDTEGTYMSGDAGNSWRKLNPPAGFSLDFYESAKITNDGKLFVLGSNPDSGYYSFYEYSYDNNTWDQINLPNNTAYSYYGLAVDNDAGKFAVIDRDDDAVYTSVDNGAHWTNVGISSAYSIFGSGDGSKLAVIDDNGKLYLSSDWGANWTQISIPGRVTNVALSPDSGTVAVAATGSQSSVLAMISNDFGATWSQHTVPDMAYTTNGLAMSSDGTNLAITGYGVNGAAIYVSSDAGATWLKQTFPDISAVNSVAGSTNFSLLAAATSRGVFLYRVEQPILKVDSTTLANSSAIPSRPTFSGTAYPNAVVTVTVHSDPIICTATADSSGNWSCTLPANLPLGEHTVLVAMTNPSTNVTTTYGPYTVNVTNNNGGITIGVPNTGVRIHASYGELWASGLMLMLCGALLLRRRLAA